MGASDYNMVYLVPTYVIKLKSSKPIMRTARTWSNESKEELAGAFACTNWNVFFESGNEFNTVSSSITDYNFFV